MRYAILAAALVASVAAVPFPQAGGPGHWGGDEYDGDCEVTYVTVDPEPTTSSSSSLIVVDPIPTTSSAVVVEPIPTTSSAVAVEPVESSSSVAETTKTRSRSHYGHGPHTGRPTGRPTNKPTSKPTPSSTPKPEPTPSSTPVSVPSTTKIPSTTMTPSTTQTPSTTSKAPEPTATKPAGENPFPYPSPSPTETSWAGGKNGETVNSAAHATSYADPATQTTEPQCTAAAQSYISAAVDGHNTHRADHQANPVVWDDSLSCIAQRQADTCIFDHLMYVNGGNYGQNLAGGIDMSSAIEMWYGEAAEYDSYYGTADPPFVAGHFTQMVWASTTSIGCATASCDGSKGDHQGDLTVCNYFAFGNMMGAYAENVLPMTGSGSGTSPAPSEESSSTGW